MRQTWEQFKSLHDAIRGEREQYGAERQESKNQLEAMQARLDELETKYNRSAVGGVAGGGDSATADDALMDKAMNAYLRRGERGIEQLSDDERDALKALSSDSDPDGGYLMPRQRANELLTALREISPVRELARVFTISTGDALEIPGEGDGDFEAGWVGERQARPETQTADFRMERIPVHEQYAQPPVTQKLLDDLDFNIEQWLNERVAERFAQIEGRAFLLGDGVGKPQGLLADDRIPTVPSGDNSKLTVDGLLDAFYDLPAEYARNGTWLMNRGTVRAIREMKDGDGRWVWAPPLGGQPATILDQPYREAVDMPAVAGGAFPVLFGDFRRAYYIVDRQGVRVLRDPYSNKPYVLFYTTRRVGGQVVRPAAMRKIEITSG